jgi:hypothetical protein
MAYEPKPNTGSIFNNDRKEQDSHPDRTGQGNIECPHCGSPIQLWLNGWLKKTKDGKSFLSLSFRNKDERKGQGRGQQSRSNSGAPPEYRPGPTNIQRESGNRYAAAKQGGGDWKRGDDSDDIPF